MGFLFNAICVGLAAVGAKKIGESIQEANRKKEETNRRKNTICYFDNGISESEFRVIVNRSRKGVRRIVGLYAEGTMVFGTVRSQSGVSNWKFNIDFNDYGKLTGRYWIDSENVDSDIPLIIASKIEWQICDCLKNADTYSLGRERVEEDCNDVGEVGFREIACCPYCGEVNRHEGAKFCMYCGRRFMA